MQRSSSCPRSRRKSVGADRPTPAFQGQRSKPLDCRRALQSKPSRLAEDDLPRASQLLEPLGEVDAVPDQRILEAFVGAEQRRRDLAGREPDAHMERLDGIGPPLQVEVGLLEMRILRRAKRTSRMISHWNR